MEHTAPFQIKKTLISECDKIADLRRLVDCNDEYKDSYLMTKEDQRRYNPQKMLRIDSFIFSLKVTRSDDYVSG